MKTSTYPLKCGYISEKVQYKNEVTAKLKRPTILAYLRILWCFRNVFL